MDEFKRYFGTFKEIVNELTYADDKSYSQSDEYKKKCEDSKRICNKYPKYVPVIVKVLDKDISIKKSKYLIAKDDTASSLIVAIRTQLSLKSDQAIFLFVGNTLLDQTKIMHDIYENYKSEKRIDKNGDQFLYVNIVKESTFG